MFAARFYLCFFLVSLCLCGFAHAQTNQPAKIWDGVFTVAQAERGKSALQQNGCNGCHGAELEGARGPSLKGDRFITVWENGGLDKLFSKIRDTMPPLNAEQVPINTKVDIIGYLLQVNGFPSITHCGLSFAGSIG